MASERRGERRDGGERRARAADGATLDELAGDVAFQDDLTGLHNRRLVTHLFTTAWADFVATHGQVSFVLIDLDGFKAINDTYGHGAGDEVLKTVAELLREQFREDDIVVRYGGDEFLVILPDAGEEGAQDYARRARETIATHRYFAPGCTRPISLPLSFSVGVASYPEAGARGDDVLQVADRRLYAEKRQRTPPRVVPVPSTWGWGATLVALCAAVVYLGFAASGRAQPRPAVAVLGFKNLAGQAEAAWLSTAFAEMLSAELAASGELRLISGEDVARARVDLVLPATDGLARDTLARVRSHLGADIVVLGSYLDSPTAGGHIRLDVRVQDAARGENLGAVTETGPRADLLALVQRTGVALRDRLGVAALSTSAARAAILAMPTTLDATRHYAEGLAALRRFDALTAREQFELAIAADPDSPLAHAALAETWTVLGYDGRAREQAKQAFDRGQRLPREERLLVEARLREAERAWGPATEIYARLFEFAPDNVDYGLSLARVQRMAARIEDSLATLAALRALPPPAGEDARIDLAEAESLPGFDQTIAAARRAIAKARAQGARLLVARARLVEAFALAEKGDYDEASESAAEARSIYADAGDRGGMARALNRMAQARPNDLPRARALTEQALAITREIGDQRWTGQLLNNLALTYSNQGDLARARPLFDEALVILRETAAGRPRGHVLLNIGRDLNSAGRPEEGRAYLRQALRAYRDVNDRLSVVYALNNLGNSAQLLGELSAAWSLYNESLPLCQAIGDRRITAYTLFDLADILFLRGDLRAARGRYEESLALREQLGLATDAAESRLALARVALAEGRPELAEAEARRALGVFAEREVGHNEAAARAELAEALLAQGRRAEAEAALHPAASVAKSLQFASTRLALAIATARTQAAHGRLAEATRALQRIADEGAALGLAREELEARFAHATLVAEPPRAEALLKALEADARRRDFGLVAKRAAAARRARSGPRASVG